MWVVDPGDTDNVFEWMKIHSKTTISGILLSHAHFDHIYGINEILTRYPQCVVYVANEYGKDALYDAKINRSKYTEEGPITLSDSAKIQYFPELLELWRGVDMKTIITHGHSDDSVCFIIEDMLFTGDTLIKNVRTVTKLKGGSVEKMKDSVNTLSELKGRNFKVMPGHGESFLLDGYDLSICWVNKS